jgi:hypothetical protein
MVGLVLLGLLAGVTAVIGVAQRSALVEDVGARSGPLTVQAQQLYRALSDADATAAIAFLSNGVEPAVLRDRYQGDIADATAALTALTAGNDAERTAVDQLATQLPVYTGLVETARAYNRQGLPLGAAYLREASSLMRNQLLPAAKRLYEGETRQLRADRSGGASFPWLAIPLVLLTLAGLWVTQRYLTRRTNRLFNIGLVVASGAAVVMLAWTGLSWLAVQAHLDEGRRTGSDQIDVMAQARIAALTARADEALTLVARGSGAAFEEDFKGAMARLAGDGQSPGLLVQARDQAVDGKVRAALERAITDAKDWQNAHTALRKLDDEGKYPEAVKAAIGSDKTSTKTAFDDLDQKLGDSIATAKAAFDEQSSAARGSATLATPGLIVLTLLLLLGVIGGVQQRIAEYR